MQDSWNGPTLYLPGPVDTVSWIEIPVGRGYVIYLQSSWPSAWLIRFVRVFCFYFCADEQVNHRRVASLSAVAFLPSCGVDWSRPLCVPVHASSIAVFPSSPCLLMGPTARMGRHLHPLDFGGQSHFSVRFWWRTAMPIHLRFVCGCVVLQCQGSCERDHTTR